MDPNLKVNIRSHFLDSGAFSLRIKQAKHIKNGGTAESFYDSEDFWHYMDSYIRFIKKYKAAIDLYANLDVIGNPKLTWRNQKYMEAHGLKPIPVVHFKTPMRWLRRYIEAGYKMIGLGGLVRKVTKVECRQWLDECFTIICPAPNYRPIVKVHGFGMTKIGFLFRYPWWSVDATTIEQMSRWGKILVPRKDKIKRGVYDYKRNYITIAMSSRVKSHKMTMHTNYLRPLEKEAVKEWLAYINHTKFFNKSLQLKTDDNEEFYLSNYFYYKEVLEKVPDFPGKFNPPARKRFLHVPKPIKRTPLKFKKGSVILYISTTRDIEEPLIKAGVKQVDLMLSFFPLYNRKQLDKRFLRIYNSRKKKRKTK